MSPVCDYLKWKRWMCLWSLSSPLSMMLLLTLNILFVVVQAQRLRCTREFGLTSPHRGPWWTYTMRGLYLLEMMLLLAVLAVIAGLHESTILAVFAGLHGTARGDDEVIAGGRIAAVSELQGMGVTTAVKEELGAGYSVTDVKELVDGNGIVAHLKLIKGSDKYGPDLQDLKVTLRS